MAYESILSRAGRLVAGIAHAAVDRAESLDPIATVEQAIREIDGEAGEARAQLGRHTAERHRIESRRAEVAREIETLGTQIETALAAGRDDLAKAGVERQMDLEAQGTALDVALKDAGERIDEASAAVQAILAARREAEARLAELKRSLQAADGASAPGSAPGRAAPDPQERALRSLEAISRLTGVPSGPAKASQMDDLERLHRARTVEERLAGLKARRQG